MASQLELDKQRVKNELYEITNGLKSIDDATGYTRVRSQKELKEYFKLGLDIKKTQAELFKTAYEFPVLLKILADNGADFNADDFLLKMVARYGCHESESGIIANLIDRLHLDINVRFHSNMEKNKYNRYSDGTGLLHKEYLSPRLFNSLVRSGIDINMASPSGNRPIHVHQHPECYQYLVDHVDDINAANSLGETALHYIIKHIPFSSLASQFKENSKEALLLPLILKSKRLDLNIQDNEGKTALHHAYSPYATRMLLEAGANPNIRDNTGKTPLFYKAALNTTSYLDHQGFMFGSGSQESAQMLIDGGTDISLIDHDGNTLLHFLFTENIYKLLIKNSLPMDHKNNKGFDAIDCFQDYFMKYKGNWRTLEQRAVFDNIRLLAQLAQNSFFSDQINYKILKFLKNNMNSIEYYFKK